MKIIRILVLLCLTYQSYGQKMPDYGLYNVHISDTGRAIRLQLIPVESLPRPKPGLDYYWFGSNIIHRQQGGYSGKLLNGTYEEYYQDRNLKVQGNYAEGLKDGLWKSWYSNGHLSEEVHWNKGELSGGFTYYDASGRMIKSGKYDGGRIEGTMITNPGTDSVKQIRYRRGIVMPKKENKFLKKINIFKRKNAAADSLSKKH